MSVEKEWKGIYDEFVQATGIQDYLVKKHKLKIFKVKKSGADQLKKCAAEIDKQMIVKDLPKVEAALAKFQKYYTQWRKQMDADHQALVDLKRQAEAAEIDVTPEELAQVKTSEVAMRLLVANVANMEMKVETWLQKQKKTGTKEKKVKFEE